MTDFKRTRVQIFPSSNDRLISAVELVANNLPELADQIWDSFFRRYGDPDDVDNEDRVEERTDGGPLPPLR